MLSTTSVHRGFDGYSDQIYRGQMTLLLVDDDPVVLSVLEAILTREGYNVIASASPTLALDLAARNSFDMLVTDFQMPEINGFKLASLLTKSRSTLPVLLLSGSDPSELPMAEIAQRHWNFMAKPADRERLLRIISGECLGWGLRKRA